MYVTNGPVGEPLKLNIENDLLLCCHDRDLKFANFTLPFRRLRQRNTLKCVPHVQHDYFSSFNQSDLCLLTIPLSSSLLKLAINLIIVTITILKATVLRNG